MPAPCTCSTTCSCSIQGDGASTAVSGLGTLASPYVVQAFENDDFPGSPTSPLTSATATRRSLPNVWWKTATMPTQYLHGADVQVGAGYLTQVEGVTATAIVTGSSTITWRAVPGATGYRLTHGPAGGVSAGTTDVDVTGTSHVLTGLSAPPHRVQVTALDSTGRGLPSAWLTFDVHGGGKGLPPVTPTGLAVSVGISEALLSWNAVPSAAWYPLEHRKVGAATWTSVQVTDLTYLVAMLQAGTAYEARVAAANELGVSAWSATLAFTTDTVDLQLPPAPPVGLAVYATGSGANTLWEPSLYATSYLLTWANPDGVGGSLTTTHTSAAVASLLPGTTYTFAVSAINQFGTGQPSAGVRLTTATATSKPDQTRISHIRASAFGDGLSVGWEPTGPVTAPVTRTTLQMKTGSGAWGTWVSYPTANADGAYLVQVTAPGTYTFRHFNSNSAGDGVLSAELAYTIPGDIGDGGLASPTGLRVGSYLDSDLLFAWDSMSGAVGYTGSVSGGGRSEQINTGGTSQVFNRPAAGVTYTLSISAHYPGGVSSPATFSYTHGSTSTVMPKPVVYWNAANARSALSVATSLPGVIAAWDAHVKPTFGVGLRMYDGSGGPYSPTVPGVEDLAAVRGVMMAVCRALAYLPTSLFTGMSIDFRDYVVTGSMTGIGAVYIGSDVWLQVDRYSGSTTEQVDSFANYLLAMHETAHAVTIGAHDKGDPAKSFWFPYDPVKGSAPRPDWLSYNASAYDGNGSAIAQWGSAPASYVSTYARSAYVEDLAESVLVLFDTNYAGLPTRMQADPGVRSKMRLMVTWLSSLGLKAFDSLLNV